MKTAESFLNNFFAARNLSGPNRQPLYRYHLRRKEFDELREVLSWELGERDFGQRRIGPKGAMALCLWASEWWRRNYEAGPWKWEALLAALDASEFGPSESRYGELQDLVTRGIRAWGRTVYRVGPSRGFLVTLACEGGLPLKLILREQTHLRNYLRDVLEEFRLFGRTGTPPRDLAERPRHRLPRAWRREVVYELSGELIQEIWRLQAVLGDTRTPIQDLDRRHPGWRNELPVRVSDDVARTLLNGLLEDAVEVARRTRLNIRWNLDLAPVANGEWEFRGSFSLPHAIKGEAFVRLFSPERPILAPPRFDLGVRTERKSFRPLALGTERQTDDGCYLYLEQVPSAQRFQTTDVLGSRKLVARTFDEEYVADQFPGASGLGDLPWVFAPIEIGESERTTCSLVGQGTVRLSEPWALVAVDEVVSVEVARGEVSVVGRTRNENHRVYRVSGKAIFSDDDGSKTTVETKSDHDTFNVEYHLQGTPKVFGGSATSAFLGGPTVEERKDGQFLARIPERHLQWKPDVPGGSWVPYSSAAVEAGSIRGRGRLRYTKGNETRYSISIGVLPSSAAIEIIPSTDARQGEIRMIGFGHIQVAVPDTSGLKARSQTETAGHRLILSATGNIPREVAVGIDWPGQGRLILTLPFPAKRATFVAADGRPLPVGAHLAQGSLAGVEAEVLVPDSARYQLQGYSSPGSSPSGRRDMFVREIPAVGFGHHLLDLAQVDSEITDRLEGSNHANAQVNLRILDAESGRPFPSASVLVSRFDFVLERSDKNPSWVELDSQSRAIVTPADLHALEVEMLSLLDPDEEPHRLKRTGTATWHVSEDALESGPYLVLGRQANLQRARPMPWYVGDPKLPEGTESDDIANVAAAYAFAFHERHSLSDKPFWPVVRDMARDPGHQDWALVFAYLRVESLPVTTFPLLRALVRDPVACSMAAADARAADFELLWERMERFPFAWWQIPMANWKEAYEAYADYWYDVLDAVGDTDQAWEILERQTDTSIDRAMDRLPGLSGAFNFLKDLAAQRPLSDSATKIVTPERLAELRKQYHGHRLTCPALNMSPQTVPDLVGLRSAVQQLVTDHPWAQVIFLQRDTGAFEEARHRDFGNAPALAAGMVLAGVRPSEELARSVRELRAAHSSWFDEALRLAQLIAFGSQKAYKIKQQLLSP